MKKMEVIERAIARAEGDMEIVQDALKDEFDEPEIEALMESALEIREEIDGLKKIYEAFSIEEEAVNRR